MASILVADDVRPVRDYYLLLLREAGHEARGADDGVAAFQAFSDRPPDLLLTDWHMPSMSGLDLILALRRLGHETPVILMSGGSTYLHGYLDELAVLRKPLEPRRLLRLVDAMLLP